MSGKVLFVDKTGKALFRVDEGKKITIRENQGPFVSTSTYACRNIGLHRIELIGSGSWSGCYLEPGLLAEKVKICGAVFGPTDLTVGLFQLPVTPKKLWQVRPYLFRSFDNLKIRDMPVRPDLYRLAYCSSNLPTRPKSLEAQNKILLQKLGLYAMECAPVEAEPAYRSVSVSDLIVYWKNGEIIAIYYVDENGARKLGKADLAKAS